MDDFQKQLSSSGVEDKDGTIDGLSGQVPFKCLKYKSQPLYFIQCEIKEN
jgi:hypothetical protein